MKGDDVQNRIYPLRQKEVEMKKLALALMLAALSSLLTPAIAPAWDEHFGWRLMTGTYEMTATGSCLHSTNGFDEIPGPSGSPGPTYVPKSGSTVWGATTTTVATWVLYKDGTGYIAGINYPIDFPPGSPGSGWGARARQGWLSYDIKYHLNGSDISFEVFLPADPNIPREKYAVKIGDWEGSVSLDKQTIIIPTVNQVFDLTKTAPALYYAICNSARVLIRVSLAPKNP